MDVSATENVVDNRGDIFITDSSCRSVSVLCKEKIRHNVKEIH